MPRLRKTQKRMRKQKGSAFVAKGSFGCVFDPAFRCQGNIIPPVDIVSKVMQIDDAEQEFDETRFLQELDPEFHYFVYPVSLCVEPAVRTNAEKAENPLQSCQKNIYSNNYLMKKELALLQMPRGGVDLSMFKPTSKARWMEGWSHLLEGLAVLHRHNRVHMDIKPLNIVCKTLEPERPVLMRYIDFGMSFSTHADISDDLQLRFLSNYAFWPYEVRFLSRDYFGEANITDESVIKYKESTSAYGRSFLPPANPFINANFYRDLWNKFQKYARMNFYLVQDFIGKATDIYALGKTLSVSYSQMTHHRILPTGHITIYQFDRLPEEQQILHTNILEYVSLPLFHLCAKMMHEDPFQRPQLPYIQLQFGQLAQKMARFVQ